MPLILKPISTFGRLEGARLQCNLVEAHRYSIGRTGQIVEQSRSSEKQIECRRFDHEGIVTDKDLRGRNVYIPSVFHCYLIAQQFAQSYCNVRICCTVLGNIIIYVYIYIYIYQSINQYLSASCHTALGHKLAQSGTIVYNSVYNSVKGSQGIGSSVRHYVPKRAFHIVWITTAALWLWQARHRILAVVSSSELEE